MKRTILLAGAALIGLGGAAYAQDNPSAPASDPMQQTMPPATEAPAPDAAATPTAPAPTPASPTDTTAPTTATEGTVGTGTTTETGTTGTTGTTGSTTTETGAGATTGTTATETTTGAPATGSASATVQADWAKYDPENSGSLTPLQFGKWILASRGQDMSAQVDKSLRSKAADLPAVKVLNATSAEFSKADADKDHKVSQAELTAYLSA